MTQTYICNKSCINYDINNIIIKKLNTNFKLMNLNNTLNNFNLISTQNTIFALFPTGNHFLLITNNTFKNTAILYDINKNKYFDVKYRFKDNIYNNTILECILTKTSNNWQLIIFNIFYYKNTNVSTQTFDYKFNLINNLINTEYINDNYIQPAELKLITYTTDSKNLEYIINNYNIDNYIFDKISIYIDNELYFINYNTNCKLTLNNFKFLDNIDIDLEDPDCTILSVNDDTINDEVEINIIKTSYRDVYKIKDTDEFINIPTIELSKLIKYKFNNNNIYTLKVICKYEKIYNSYYVIRLVN